MGLGVVAAGAAAGFAFLPNLGFFQPQRPDLITHVVQRESLPVTVVERGTLESANNQELTCQVKAGSRGTFASSIKWVIDDGTIVAKGQLVLELDDSALREQEQTQNIAVAKARSEYIRAKEDLEIQKKANVSDITLKTAALEVAEIDLEKFLGITRNPEMDTFAAVAGAAAGLEEKGEFQMRVDDLSAQLKLAQSDLEAYRDRSAWVERAARAGYQTPSQVGVEMAKFDSARDQVQKLSKEKYALEKYTRKRELADLVSKVKVAEAGVEQALLEAHAKEVQAESLASTTYSVYLQEVSKLAEIEQQLSACKMVAPQSGMVVYYKDQSSRWSSNNEGLIQIGAQVKEGQKLLRIPDLTSMQVNTKIHEALVSRIEGDDRRPTGVIDAFRAGLLLAYPHPLSKISSQAEAAFGPVREAFKDQEYYVANPGQSAIIRVDAFPGRVFSGRVRSVAAVASQADWSSSDVKLFPTLVSIEDTNVVGLKPDMSAEVTIQIDPGDSKVLTVPIQAVVGGADLGPKRSVYVIEDGVPQERQVDLGGFNDQSVEVKSGLQEGDVIVVNPKAVLGDKARGTREAGDPSGRGGGKGPPKGGPRGGGGQPKPDVKSGGSGQSKAGEAQNSSAKPARKPAQ